MGYEVMPDNALRLGDVVCGLPLCATSVDNPTQMLPEEHRISLRRPHYTAVLTPCCSIRNKRLVVAPLLPVRVSFFSNPYLESDLTRINRRMKPEQAVEPAVWGRMTQADKQERFGSGQDEEYAFLGLYVYAGHSLLEEYVLRNRDSHFRTNCYMVDFGSMNQVECPQIEAPDKAPMGIKLLQLTVEAREELRLKLLHYFGRTPAEDQP